MWGEQNCLNFEMAVGETEPPSPQLTIRCSTAQPLLPTSLVFSGKLPNKIITSDATKQPSHQHSTV